MVAISRAEYEAMQAKLTMQNQQLDEQNKQLEAKSAELAQALLQNQWLTEQLLVKKRKLFGSSSEVLDQMVMEQFAHLFNEAECWDAAGRKPAVKAEKKKTAARTAFYKNRRYCILAKRSTALVNFSIVASASPCSMPSRTQCLICPSSTTCPALLSADFAALI